MVYTDVKEEGAQPFGAMKVALASVPTPIPKRHDITNKERLKIEKQKKKSREGSRMSESRAESRAGSSWKEGGDSAAGETWNDEEAHRIGPIQRE